MLEASVEWMHHRSLVREARANIRQELSNNADQAGKDLDSLKQDEDRLTRNLRQLEAIRANHSVEHRQLEYTLNWNSFSDAAWQTARDTGALSYMTYAQVQNLADVYGQQGIVNRAAENLFEEQPLSLAPLFIFSDVSKVNDVEVQRMQERSADELISVRVLEQVVSQLKQQYESTLKKV